jgi:MoaA/NifB/PqqE/SkfB family radical SAM enzyme
MKNKEVFSDRGKLSQANPAETERVLDFLSQKGYALKYTRDTIRNRTFINSVLPSTPSNAWNRFIHGSGRISQGDRVPLWMDIVATGRCHCDCWHCFRSSFTDTSDLSLSAIETIIQDAYELGTVMLGITGGEPMMHPDLVDIINMVPKGMEIQLYTTGYQMNDSFIRSVETSQLTRCIISLDHYQPEIINARRKNREAFDEAIMALKSLSQSSIYTTAAVCITEDLCNEQAFYRYMDMVCLYGIDEIRVILPVPLGRLQGEDHKRLYLKSHRLMKKVKNETAGNNELPNILIFSEMESRACFGCGAGFQYVSVNNDGAVTPCVAVPLVFGNIHHSNLRDIYSDMGRYFKSSGRTCLGRRLGRASERMCFTPDTFPYSLGDSQMLASHCMIEGRPGNFFRYMTME